VRQLGKAWGREGDLDPYDLRRKITCYIFHPKSGLYDDSDVNTVVGPGQASD
jgi:hypothetical protein